MNGELAGTGKGFKAEGVAFVRNLHASIAIAKIGVSDDDGCKLFGGSREVEAVSADVDRDRVAFIDEAARAIVGDVKQDFGLLAEISDIAQSPFARRATALERLKRTLRGNGGHSDTVGVATSDMDRTRSEEHTSELQSLMRISYAVFCLKKKNQPH